MHAPKVVQVFLCCSYSISCRQCRSNHSINSIIQQQLQQQQQYKQEYHQRYNTTIIEVPVVVPVVVPVEVAVATEDLRGGPPSPRTLCGGTVLFACHLPYFMLLAVGLVFFVRFILGLLCLSSHGFFCSFTPAGNPNVRIQQLIYLCPLILPRLLFLVLAMASNSKTMVKKTTHFKSK